MGKLRFRRVSARGWWYLGGTAKWPRERGVTWFNIPYGGAGTLWLTPYGVWNGHEYISHEVICER